MKNLIRYVLQLLLLLSVTVVTAQNQSADYNRLSAATKNAFSVAERQYTYKIETKYADNNTAGGNNSSSSSSGTSSVSGNYSAYPAINVNKRRLEQQAAAGARQEARIISFETKMKRVDELIKSRNLQRTPENHAALLKAALEGGLNAYEASRFFGNSPQEYRTMLLSKNAADYSWSGGVKGDCQNDCIENLTSPYGFTYKGNTKYGKPHGKGVMIGEKATYTGDFLAGEPNGQVEIRWNSGSVFTGTSFNGELIKGTLNRSGLNFKGTFLNGSYYRGLMKVDGMEILGEFDSKPSLVYGMNAYSNGDTTHGFYSGKEGTATYYQLKVYKAGLKEEEIFDNNQTVGDVRYYIGGQVFYTLPYSENRRLGFLINADSTAYYAYLLTDVNKISPIQNLTQEQLLMLKEKMETFINEVQRRREEYREKMELVYDAIR
ncbi:MAG: hypothetical protein IT250_12295 [Chitinophagaceae bacterium]|nr:hypothetical protein [Chitinophagaceae bacterium]